MLRSVRTGGLAAALFATLCGGTTASAQDQLPAAAPVAVAQTVVVDTSVVDTSVAAASVVAAPVAAEAETPAAAKAPARRSLAALTAEHAATATTGADHECLATTVYFEARGESLAGQLAVAEVVLNRAASGRFPANVCAVVKQKSQFSFVRNGQFPKADRASAAWKKAVAIARIAQDQLADELPGNVLYYHASYVAPSWGKRLTQQARIGTHIFYS